MVVSKTDQVETHAPSWEAAHEAVINEHEAAVSESADAVPIDT